MRLSVSGFYLLLCCGAVFVRLTTGSAWLQDPPSRSALWMYGIQARPNYDFRTLNCGGDPVQIEFDGSRNCGICGDPVSDPLPRPNENGGKYADPIIRTRYFESGTVADISVRNNLIGAPGFYEFRLCTDGLNPTQECLNRNLLTIVDVNSTNVDVPSEGGTTVFHVQLPAGVTCSHCLFQWRFRKEKSIAGCDNTNWCGLGRGPQIEFYNCADIIIGAVGQPKPTDPGVLQEPKYDQVDYGSAYDVATTLTTNNGVTPNPQVRTTTDHDHDDHTTTASPTTTTSRFNVVTIPTAIPGTTTTTTQAPITAPASDRLIIGPNGVGQTVNGVTTLGGSNSRINTAPLLLLLGLLPLLGAASLRTSGPVPITPVAPQGFWVATPVLSQFNLGANYGYGNFGNNGLKSFGSYGTAKESYGTYGKSYGIGRNNFVGTGNNVFFSDIQPIGQPILNPLPQLANADFARSPIQLRELVQTNGNIIRSSPSEYSGGTIAPLNPVNWNGGSGHNYQSNSMNHPVPFQKQVIPFEQQQQQYQSGPSNPMLPHDYNQNNIGPGQFPNPVQPVLHNTRWQGNNNNNINRFNGNNNINNFNGNNMNTFNGNTNFNNNNQNNFNGISTGQRVPVQGTIARPPTLVTSQQRPVNTQFDLPVGVASESRFQQTPRLVTISDRRSLTGSQQFGGSGINGRQLSTVDDWYYQLMNGFPVSDIAPR